ncbi:tetratricopeptide repeat protein [Marmoricola sp. RAF53]|uniref:tetratricopeptide repeat protein n=1 Tax=Marmoricola sp. RAF53 TaxID=3233059 RepID=UPI003F9D9FB9
MDDRLLASVEAAVAALPENLSLRVRLADLLVHAGRPGEAVQHAAAALAVDPGYADARAVMGRALAAAPTMSAA